MGSVLAKCHNIPVHQASQMRGRDEEEKTAAPPANRIMVVLSLLVGGETVKRTVATFVFVAFSRFPWF